MREMMASRRVRWYSPSSTRALPHALHSQPFRLTTTTGPNDILLL
jgi:hypothetical protein